jgi:hypothetical protein
MALGPKKGRRGWGRTGGLSNLTRAGLGDVKSLSILYLRSFINAVCSELITAMIAACSQLTTAHTCPNFRQASFATDPISASADQCPLSLQ